MNSFVRLIIMLFVLGLFCNNSKAQTYFKGEFISKKRITYFDSTDTHTTIIVMASMYTDSVKDSLRIVSSDCGSVSFNGTHLAYHSGMRFYMDTIVRTEHSGMTWNFSSTNSVMPSFSTALVDSFPSITNLAAIPDTIHKTTSLVVDFGSVYYADQIEFQIYDSTLSITNPYNRLVAGSTTSISIPSSDLDHLNGHAGYIYIEFSKLQYVLVSGVRYKIVRRFDLTRPVFITD